MIELLVVITILFILISLTLPALNAVRSSAKRLVCAANLRTVVSEFSAFADGTHPQGKGHSEALGQERFQINDFQDLLYRIDEFWDRGDAKTGLLSSEKDPVLCPSGTAKLSRRMGFPCGREAISPVGDVSIALNMRLYRPVVNFRGKNVMAATAAAHVSSRILDYPHVPLALDVDGSTMTTRGVDPFYIAPPVEGADDAYASGRFWVQSTRHGHSVNVGFVGGHVLSSQNPAEERWNWSYQAETR